MKVLCMPQAFKGCLSAREAAQAMAEGVRAALPGAEAIVMPMADGGDDTLDVLVGATRGRLFSAQALGPVGQPVAAQWGVLGDGETAVIEMAKASGLSLLPPAERNPRVASSYGTCQLIRAALDAGYRQIIVGVGGSATVDGGAGAARALGARFLDARGRALPHGGAALARLASIDLAALDPRVRQASISVACDVDIPVCGPRGAWSFSFQKGATPEVARELAAALEHFCRVVRDSLGIDLSTMAYSGPAGGLAGGLHAFLGAKLVPGAELVLSVTGAGALVPKAGLIITGEGMLDRQSFNGKGPAVIAARARKAGVPVIAVVGQVSEDLPDLEPLGIRLVEPLVTSACGPQEAQANARALIVAATASAIRRLKAHPVSRYN